MRKRYRVLLIVFGPLFGFGVLLILINSLFIRNSGDSWLSFLFILLRDLGLALVAVGITAPISVWYLHDQVDHYMSIISGATESGIVNIFAKRIDADAEAAMLQAIQGEQREMFIAGIGLATFFVEQHGRPLTQAITHKLRSSSEFLCKILLCDVGSPYLLEPAQGGRKKEVVQPLRDCIVDDDVRLPLLSRQ